MQIYELTSAANENIKRWKKIAFTPRANHKFGLTIAEGLHLAEVIAQRQVPAKSVILRQNRNSGEADIFAQAIESECGARVYELPEALYESICPVEASTGIMVEIECQSADRPAVPLPVDALYLDGVQDAGNMGTLIRTAVAAGVKHIAASRTSSGFWTPKVLRAGMGAHFAAHLYENVSPDELHALFKSRIIAADARGGVDLFRTPAWEEGTTVWMMGAEGPGLSDAALDVADMRCLIPIEDDCESLNVAAAASVCLFEQRRRRLMR
ncbi:MAG: RNA methyltransferase [Sutterellaceae bacterium]|nr:RNA methyltransferase [Sutterellaceae bacterium]